MNFRLNYSFRWQLSFLIITLSLIIGSGSFLYLRYQQQSFIQTNLQSQGEAIVNLVAEDLVRLMTLSDPDVAATIAYHFKRVPEIQRVLFYDLQMKPVLVISNHKNDGSPEATVEESIEINTDIFYEGMALGAAHFVFYSQQLNKEQKNAEEIFISLIAALFLLSLLFAFYIDRKFIARLSGLSFALKYTAENNDFSRRLKTGKSDEIGQAIQNFNLLLSKVEEKTNSLLFQANHDGLTSLYNRNQLLLHLEALLKDRPEQGYHAVCYLDLDKFKVVNDTCGHIAGDELLKQLSLRMLKVVSSYQECALGRLGGDEFLILIEDLAEDRIRQIVNNVQQVVNTYQFKYFEREFVVGASMGCVIFQAENTTAGELLSVADAACYQIKHESPGSFYIHRLSDSNLKDFQQAMNWVSRLYRAMDQDAFQLYLQPIVVADQKHKTFDHFETLIRLVDQGEVISPGIFIPIAEKYGLSKKIDLWVIENICRSLNQNPQFVERLNIITINLSALTIVDPSAIQAIDSIVQKYKTPYAKLCFEITETAVVSQLETARKFIKFFNTKGVKFALDDFGSGMSSFGYLTQLDVDYLKIDGSFIREMEDNNISQELVSAMIRIGKITQKEVIAEQVESLAVVNMLQDMGVDYIQGYYYGKPEPVESYIDSLIK